MGLDYKYFDELDAYEARQELNAYYDEQDDRFVESMQNEEPIEEVVE